MHIASHSFFPIPNILWFILWLSSDAIYPFNDTFPSPSFPFNGL